IWGSVQHGGDDYKTCAVDTSVRVSPIDRARGIVLRSSRMHGLRLVILCVVALQGLSGCAFYQFRVWPDYGLLSRSVSATGNASEQQWASANASLSETLAV